MPRRLYYRNNSLSASEHVSAVYDRVHRNAFSGPGPGVRGPAVATVSSAQATHATPSDAAEPAASRQGGSAASVTAESPASAVPARSPAAARATGGCGAAATTAFFSSAAPAAAVTAVASPGGDARPSAACGRYGQHRQRRRSAVLQHLCELPNDFRVQRHGGGVYLGNVQSDRHQRVELHFDAVLHRHHVHQRQRKHPPRQPVFLCVRGGDGRCGHGRVAVRAAML